MRRRTPTRVDGDSTPKENPFKRDPEANPSNDAAKGRFFELSLNLLCIAGFDGYFKELNGAWQKTLGYSPSELKAKPYVEFVHPDDRAATIAEAGKIERAAKTLQFENRYLCKDGSYKWLLWNALPVAHEKLIYAAAQDVCAQHLEPGGARQNLAAIVSSSDDAIIGKTLDGVITSWNAGAEKLYGYKAEEMIGQKIFLLVPPGTPNDVPEILGRIRTGEAIKQHETIRRRKDGSIITVSTTTSPIRGIDGKITGASVIARDITEKKQVENQIRELNRALERRVGARTAELVEANKALESFSYSVSHDLRAPLRAINGFSKILMEDYGGSLDDEGRRILGVVRRNALRMSQLIDDLLSFFRLSRQEMTREAIDICDLAKSIFAEIGGFKQGCRPAFVVKPMPPAHGDPAMIRQAMINLISNAVKFSNRRDDPRIEIGGREGDGESIYWVKDNGVGFDMKYAGKLFGVFQRLHAQDEFEGTGVGLAIVHRVITRHGGRIWAEARLGRGAVFYFALPEGGLKCAAEFVGRVGHERKGS